MAEKIKENDCKNFSGPTTSFYKMFHGELTEYVITFFTVGL